MKDIVTKELDTALSHWNAMSRSDQEEAEEMANAFEAAFYRFIDALREWVYALNPRPQTLDELLEMPFIRDITDRLPAPLYLNFETEAELIMENRSRIDDEKYD
ncbi:hypothetical protein [Paenibacillus sp. OAS669]|uniref:hypothetical protein n=1 Tax=Paenibacillus sp. OAS669 TaxID=2663821 RepID=UPI00178A8749|nr:hypothetical protein [Paenibacillus sp. OAS669]MBE1442464.1 hypothetical protein [Paenibacillus sp. OAS669]